MGEELETCAACGDAFGEYSEHKECQCGAYFCSNCMDEMTDETVQETHYITHCPECEKEKRRVSLPSSGICSEILSKTPTIKLCFKRANDVLVDECIHYDICSYKAHFLSGKFGVLTECRHRAWYSDCKIYTPEED
jgi:hypothetical protein